MLRLYKEIMRTNLIVKHQVLSLLWLRKSLFVIVSFLVFAGISMAVVLWPRTYTATARLLLENKQILQGSRAESFAQYQRNYLATQIEILQSARVAFRVGDILQLKTNQIALEKYKKERIGKETFVQFYIEQLKRGVTATQSGDASVIEVTYSANDPGAAALAANAFVRAYIEVNRELRADEDLKNGPIILDEAALPHSPISPRVLPGFFAAILLAPLIGLLAVMLSEAMDRRVRNRVDLEDISGASVLCVVGAGRPSRTLAILQTMLGFLLPNSKIRAE
jgi:uncharacterized protein involved in exopolysaccharide biosynthesis